MATARSFKTQTVKREKIELVSKKDWGKRKGV